MGIKRDLEPVIYTYDNSITGGTFMENLKISGRLLKLSHDRELKKHLTTLVDNSINNLQYLKPYIVTNQKGQEFIAYNDREWRYVHKHDIYNSIFLKTVF